MSPDFTTARYRDMLKAAQERFSFVRFGESFARENIALWRHDIDFSPQRSLALARIENEMGVPAIYFVHIASRYYNAFEPNIAAMLREIQSLGHDIGVHFDAEVYKHKPQADYESRLILEAKLIEEIVEAPVRVFSLHNPTTMVGVAMDSEMHGGLINASTSALRQHFAYCSDSNGVWRYRPMMEMIEDPQVRRFYALTHPEWWQEEAMSPRQRIQRCIDGRKVSVENYYDALLSTNDRPNIGSNKA